jgi:GT2 family glycosyltransferase
MWTSTAAVMTRAVAGFSGLEHALEPVGEVGGVRFVNDSKATNVEAALRAIQSFGAGLVVILGGRFKGGEFSDLRDALRARKASVVAIGEAAPLIHQALEPAVPVRDAADMVAAEFPEVSLVRNDDNRGFSRANNQGFREARGRKVLLLNPDAQVQEGAIDRLVAFLDAHPDVGIAGGRVNSPDGTLQRASRRSIPTPMVSLFRLAGLSRIFPNHPAARAYNLEDADPSETMDVGAVMGAFLMVRREAIEKTGGMDERYFLYGEDIDFCMAVRAAGWRVVYYPEAVVIHRKGASSRQSRLKANREFHRSMVLFHDKHFARTTPWWANFLIRAAIAARGTAFDWALRLDLIRHVGSRG